MQAGQHEKTNSDVAGVPCRSGSLSTVLCINAGAGATAGNGSCRSGSLSTVLCIGILAALYGWFYLRHIPQLGLYSDDWARLSQAVHEPLSHLALTWPLDYRPLEMLPWVLAYHAFGPAIAWYYAGMFCIDFATAVVLFRLARGVTGSALLGLSVAALWVVSPVDTSVFWLTTIAYRTGALFFLTAVTLIVLPGPAQRPRLRYWAAVLCCALCLASNELYLGLAMLLPVLVVVAHRDRRALPAIGRALPMIMLLVAYVGYRFWLGPDVLHLFDNNKGVGMSLPG